MKWVRLANKIINCERVLFIEMFGTSVGIQYIGDIYTSVKFETCEEAKQALENLLPMLNKEDK